MFLSLDHYTKYDSEDREGREANVPTAYKLSPAHAASWLKHVYAVIDRGCE